MLAQAERDARGRRQENFVGGAWVSLSIGHTKQAEPRWLIPMLCKAGGLSKRQLGAIQIGPHETFVEIDAASIDAFMARIGEGGRIEKGIHITRVARAPEQTAPRAPRATPPPEPRRGKPAHRLPPKHGKGKPAGASAPARPIAQMAPRRLGRAPD